MHLYENNSSVLEAGNQPKDVPNTVDAYFPHRFIERFDPKLAKLFIYLRYERSLQSQALNNQILRLKKKRERDCLLKSQLFNFNLLIN